MKKACALIAVLLFYVGCSPLIPVYAPHRDNTAAHREATDRRDCIGCHDVSNIRKHDPQQDCLRCHRLNEVY